MARGTLGPHRNNKPPSIGPTKPLELSTASMTPKRPPVWSAGANREMAEAMAVFRTPSATITPPMITYTATMELVIIASTRPRPKPATHSNKTTVGSSPDILMKTLANTP